MKCPDQSIYRVNMRPRCFGGPLIRLWARMDAITGVRTEALTDFEPSWWPRSPQTSGWPAWTCGVGAPRCLSCSRRWASVAFEHLPERVANRIPEGLARVAARQDRAPILPGYTEHSRPSGIREHQLVTDRAREQDSRRDTGMGSGVHADQLVPVVFGVVDERSRDGVYPVIANDAVPRRVRAGDEDGVADGGLGIRMAVVSIRLMHALFEEISEAALRQPFAVAHREITAQPIDADLYYESRWREWLRCLFTEDLGAAGEADREHQGEPASGG